MADVFLSYKREDRKRAAAVVAGLQAAGLSVWWDEALTARRAWDATIEAEIAGAAYVVVLWSPRSVASDWVRTEAHYAQNRSKLVPALIEPCQIPLAFMLRQAVDLSAWRGDAEDPAWRKLLEALSAPETRAGVKRAPARAAGLQRPVLALSLGAGVAIALVTAVLLGLHPWAARAGDSGSVRVARLDASAGDTAATIFAQGFAADLAQNVTAGGSKLRVLDGSENGGGGGGGPRADYTLNGAVRTEGVDLKAALTLTSNEDGAIIWSSTLKRPAAEAEDMHREAEVRVGGVFVCALDAAVRDRSIVSVDALKIYMQACEQLPSGDDLRTRKLLRDVVALAPRFAKGWGILAEWDAFIANDSDPGASDARRAVAEDSARALALDPRTAPAWTARAMLKTHLAEWMASEQTLKRALAIDPDDPIGNFFYASDLYAVGRLGEALDYAQRAAGSGPRFWPKDQLVILITAAIGNTDDAWRKLSEARRTWPEPAQEINVAGFAARELPPDQAAATLRDPQVIAGASPARIELLRLEASLRKTPDAAAAARAAQLVAQLFQGPENLAGAVLNFVAIGRLDDAYARLSAAPQPLTDVSSANPAFMFHSYAAGFRADPRFPELARRLGLTSIWRRTRWPDFCQAADAPAVCRTVEASPRAASPHP